MARVSRLVCRTSGSTPFSRMSAPPRRASRRACSDNCTSTQPVNWLLLFHSLWPWRSRRRVDMVPILAYADGASGPAQRLPFASGEPRERLQVGGTLPALAAPRPFASDRGFVAQRDGG